MENNETISKDLIQATESVDEFGLHQYMQDCMSELPMTPTETADAFAELNAARKAGDVDKEMELKRNIATHNMRLVYYVARKAKEGKFLYYGVTMQDLLSEGFIGLMRAIDKYDEKRGTRFSTYATTWIQHSLQDAAAKYGNSLCSFPTHIFQNVKKYIAVYRKNQNEMMCEESNRGAQESERELLRRTSVECGVPVEVIQEALIAVNVTVPLDMDITSNTEGGIKETLESYSIPDSSADFETQIEARMEMEEVISLAKEILDPRCFDIFFSVCCQNPPQSYEEIGKRWGLQKERVRQLDRRSRELLRFIIRNGSLPPTSGN